MDRERISDGELGGPSEEPETRTDVPVETVEDLRAEVARLRDEAERNWQQFLRTAADLENYRKQAARQREEAVAATRLGMLNVILGVVDTLERALEHAEGRSTNAGPRGGGAASAITEGIRLAHRQVLDKLRSLGVSPMETIGTRFDPRLHEAVEAVPATTTEPGTVVGEVERGYMLGDEVLRPAKVRVAQ